MARKQDYQDLEPKPRYRTIKVLRREGDKFVYTYLFIRLPDPPDAP